MAFMVLTFVATAVAMSYDLGPAAVDGPAGRRAVRADGRALPPLPLPRRAGRRDAPGHRATALRGGRLLARSSDWSGRSRCSTPATRSPTCCSGGSCATPSSASSAPPPSWSSSTGVAPRSSPPAPGTTASGCCVSVTCVYGTYVDPTLPLSWLLMIPCVWGGLTLTIRGTAYLVLTVALCAAAMTLPAREPVRLHRHPAGLLDRRPASDRQRRLRLPAHPDA